MKKQLRRFFGRDDEAGQAIILFAIIMLALLFAVGLAIDAGQLYSAKRTEQEAADAAAFAGAVVLYQNGTGAQAVQAAKDDAQTNGYVNGVNLTTVVVNWPPQSGTYVGNVKHVEVIITRQVKTSLVPAEAVFNPVRARGVAGAEPLNNAYAIMALNRGNIPDAFLTNNNNAHVALTGGGILVNSTASGAAENNTNDISILPVGTYSVDVRGTATGTWPMSITVNQGHIQEPDPFAGWDRPNPAVLGLPTCNSLAACRDVNGHQMPGVYTVNLGGTGTLELNPGIYVLKNGMDTAGNADINGSGVLIFNTYNTYPLKPGVNPNCGHIDLSGNASTNLSAMTTGFWKNMLIYQDAACDDEMKIRGNGSFTGTGSIYIPSAAFTFDGQNATLIGSQLVASTVDLQEGNITINFNPVNTSQPILPRLAE
jgi:hypothetical protein